MTRLPRAALVLVSLLVLLTVTALDSWKISGEVIDGETGLPVENAGVIVAMFAEEFESPIPHAWTSSSRCVNSISTQTDEYGRFEIRELTLGLGLHKKQFVVDVFKPGWHQDERPFHSIATTVISPASHIVVKMRRSENQPSVEIVRSAASMGMHVGGCNAGGERIVIDALEFAISRARSEQEFRIVRLRCHEALQRSLSRRKLGKQLPTAEWPGDVAPSCRTIIN